MNKMHSIYLATNKQNGKVYVGKTHHPLTKRFRQHVAEAGRGAPRYFCKAIRKHGAESFELVELATAATPECASLMEQIAIAAFDACNPLLGYNSTIGGEGTPGHPVSLESREKMRQAHLGQKPSPQAIRASIEARRGRPQTARQIQSLIERNRARKGEKKGPMSIEQKALLSRLWTPERRAELSARVMGHPAWNAVDVKNDDVVRLHSEGLSVRKISAELGFSRGAITTRLRKLGLEIGAPRRPFAERAV